MAAVGRVVATSRGPFFTMKLFIISLFIASFCQAGEPQIIAHRGASHAAPENTMASFNLAWKEGADGIEGDFWLSKDGKIICMHDADTERTTGVKKVTKETNWSDLKTLDAGSWKNPKYKSEPIPLLDDILKALPADKMFFVEIKCGPEIIPALAKVFEETKADPARVIVISFDEAVVSAARHQLPEYKAHLISSLKKFDKGGNEQKFTTQIEKCGAQGLQFQSTAKVPSAWLESQKERGMKLTAWVIDDAATVERLENINLDFMTTNRPAALRKILKNRPVSVN